MTLKELVAKHRAAADAPPPPAPVEKSALEKDIEARDQALIELEAARTAAIQERDFAQAEAAQFKSDLDSLTQRHEEELSRLEASLNERADRIARDLVAAQGIPAENLPASPAGADSTADLITALRAELAAVDPADGEKRGKIVAQIRALQSQHRKPGKN